MTLLPVTQTENEVIVDGGIRIRKSDRLIIGEDVERSRRLLLKLWMCIGAVSKVVKLPLATFIEQIKGYPDLVNRSSVTRSWKMLFLDQKAGDSVFF